MSRPENSQLIFNLIKTQPRLKKAGGGRSKCQASGVKEKGLRPRGHDSRTFSHSLDLPQIFWILSSRGGCSIPLSA